MAQHKILILRFSSFGDVTQTLSVPSKIAEYWPAAEIHWAIREDLSTLLEKHPHIHKIWSLPRKSGKSELLNLARALAKENFTHVYDAHNSTRSLVISTYLKLTNWKIRVLRKSQKRWKRFLLFRFHKNTYRMPFSGQRDLLEPLKKWGMSESLPPTPQLFLTHQEFLEVKKLLPAVPFVTLAPSAAFELKRWPLDYWKELIQMTPNQHYVLLGGPEDKFIEEIRSVAPERVVNLAGKTNLRDTSAVVGLSQALITNDTGILHTAEQQGHPAIALMGPAPFGFPSRPSTLILERNLSCRPCSKHGQGPCVNVEFHKCLRDITPREVAQHLKEKLAR
jgi:ADP-heptose:LPS heptosyltransferase